MNPWTALLESLHSALIDELNKRFPDEKPELGLPLRQNRLALPDPSLDAVVCEVKFDVGAPGFALLAYSASFMKSLGLKPDAFWQVLLKRAGSEFMRRGIKPVLGRMESLKEGKLPSGYPEPGRVIWVPFGVASNKCYLGVGV